MSNEGVGTLRAASEAISLTQIPQISPMLLLFREINVIHISIINSIYMLHIQYLDYVHLIIKLIFFIINYIKSIGILNIFTTFALLNLNLNNMARRAITKDFKLGFIEAHLEFYKGKHPSAEIDNYKDVDDKKLDSYYRKVYTDVASNSEVDWYIDDVKIAHLKPILEYTIQNLMDKNLTYNQWKDIKEVAEKFVICVDAKMKEAASAALAEKSECLAKLQAEIDELKAKV